MTKYDEKVEEFHKAMALPINVPFNVDLLKLRRRLIEEETVELFAELDAAMTQIQEKGKVDRPTFENMCKEMADVQYALSGLAISFGLPLEDAFDATHESNMSKLGADGKPIYREDGKITKGPNFHKAELSNLKQRIDE